MDRHLNRACNASLPGSLRSAAVPLPCMAPAPPQTWPSTSSRSALRPHGTSSCRCRRAKTGSQVCAGSRTSTTGKRSMAACPAPRSATRSPPQAGAPRASARERPSGATPCPAQVAQRGARRSLHGAQLALLGDLQPLPRSLRPLLPALPPPLGALRPLHVVLQTHVFSSFSSMPHANSKCSFTSSHTVEVRGLDPERPGKARASAAERPYMPPSAPIFPPRLAAASPAPGAGRRARALRGGAHEDDALPVRLFETRFAILQVMLHDVQDDLARQADHPLDV